MAVSQDQKIFATQFNDIQNKVASVLGNGTGDIGYGQIVSSRQASVGEVFRQQNWDNLRQDMLKCRQHQTGLDESSNLAPITTSTTLSADIFNQYETFANTIFNERRNIAIVPDVNVTVQGAVSSPLVQKSYSSNWNKKLYLIITCQFQEVVDDTRSFSAADSARHFFNAGGEIRLDLDIANANNKKEQEYEQMFDEFGIVRLKADETTNGTNTVNRGFNQLTTSDQQIWSMAGRGYYYYAYSNLDTVVTASTNADKSSIVFTIELRDDDYGNIDEAIDATITGKVFTLQPVGDNVELSNPTFTSTNWSGSYDSSAAQPPSPPPPPPPASTPVDVRTYVSSTSVEPGDIVGWSVDYDNVSSGSITLTNPGSSGTTSLGTFSGSSSKSGFITAGLEGTYTVSATAIGVQGDSDSDSASFTASAAPIVNTATVSPNPTYFNDGTGVGAFTFTVTGAPNGGFTYTSSSPDTPEFIESSNMPFTLDSNGVYQTPGVHTGRGTFYYTFRFDSGTPSSIFLVHQVL